MSDVNTADEPQEKARGALGLILDRLLEHLAVWRPESPAFVERISFQVLGHVLQTMATAHKLMAAGEETFTYASGVSGFLRALADIHARQLWIWNAEDSDTAVRGVLAEALRQEGLALDAAEETGQDIEALREKLDTLEGADDVPMRVNIAEALRAHGELEVLTVYRWESGQVHLGAAALAAGGRTIEREDERFDVAMWPVSLWRVSQLTWATYGVGLRAVSHLCYRLGFTLDDLAETESTARRVARAAAFGLRSSDEPPSPQYGLFDFPLWIPSG